MLRQYVLKRHLKKQKGMASMEAMFSIILYLALLSFSLGFFGVVHSGIVNSIAARYSAFDIFNNRTYLKYHRDNEPSIHHSHKKNGFRFHTIISEENSAGDTDFVATQRYIAFAKIHEKKRGVDNNKRRDMVEEARNNNNDKGYSFNPVWVKTGYGICLNAFCNPE